MITKSDSLKYPIIAKIVIYEVEKALKQHPVPMRSAHEGYAILKEEVDELWDAIKLKEDDPTRDEQIREEAYHVAAMSLRFLHNVVYKDD